MHQRADLVSKYGACDIAWFTDVKDSQRKFVVFTEGYRCEVHHAELPNEIANARTVSGPVAGLTREEAELEMRGQGRRGR